VDPRQHAVQFYEDDEVLSRAVASFLADGIAAGDTLVLIATEAHGRAFLQRLESMSFGVEQLRQSGQLMLLDADERLAAFMRDGEPDAGLFEREVGSLIARLTAALSGSARLRAYGEMVDVLWKAGERKAALRLEELWNDLQSRHSFTLLCAYAMASFYKEPAALQRVCSSHTHVLGDAESDANGRDANLLMTGLPPQHAHTLARERAERENVEQALRESLRELRQKEAALRASEEQLRDFVENATLGLHRVGRDGTILWANRAELELLGYAEAEYVGRSIREFHVDRGTIDDILARLARGEALHDYEARLRARDGSIRHVLISSNVYRCEGEFVHTRCFTRDITERRKAQEALRENERQLELITDALPVLVSYVDRDRRYRFVSAAYERCFGRPRAEVLGRHLEEVLGPAAYEAVRPHVDRALSGAPITFEAELPYADCGLRWVEGSYIPQFGEGGSVLGYVGLVADVTERKNLERFRAAAVDRAERLLRVTGAIADAISELQIFEALVDHVAAAVEASSAALWLIDEDNQSGRLVRSVGYSDVTSHSLSRVSLDMAPGIPIVDAIRQAAPIWIASQAELFDRYPHLRAMATAGQTYRVSCLPLVAHGRVLGALALTIEETRFAREDERDFLLLIARYASQALERLRLFEAERKSRAAADAAAVRMGVLGRASRVFVDTNLDLESRLRGVVVALGTSLGSGVGISLLAADGLLHTAAVHHPVAEARELLEALGRAHPVRLSDSISGSVVRTGQSVRLAAIDPEEMKARAAPAYRAYLDRFPSYAMLCVPLRTNGRIIGIVMATRAAPGETYTSEDLHLFEDLAERAAGAIENSRLYQETLDARCRAEQLYRFAQAVVVAESVEQVFEAALAAIETALGTTRSAILTFDSQAVMRFRSWHNLSASYRSAVEGHSPWPPDASAPQPVLVPDAERDGALAPYLPLFRSEGIGALAFIPLVNRGVLLGKFMVYYDRPHSFAGHELETAGAIANHLGSVIARFQAMTELEETVRSNELFAGVLAHDLRNPLAAIMTAAQLELMRREGQNVTGSQDARPIGRILSSGQRMARMIAQLLDFTRARSGGGIEIEPCQTDLAELCAQAVSELELAHPEWKFQCQTLGDSSGTWDPDRLLQVISNVVANAVQHGKLEGGIQITLDGTDTEKVRVRVHNQGAISESLLPRLFDPFRGAQHRGNQSRGLGLGLFIIREIILAHGGTVQVSSEPASGTTVAMELPRHSSRRALPARGLPRRANSGGSAGGGQSTMPQQIP
jgi:PAS domain S-box-containing protein